jgi:uncharacterized protein with GYD domain
MPTYISLMKFTDQGVKDVKEAPMRAEQLIKGLEFLGDKLIGLYLTIGEYDYIRIAEASSNEVALTLLICMGTTGNVKTTTLNAFTLEEFAGIVKRLPSQLSDRFVDNSH